MEKERVFMALLLNKNKLFDITVIKDIYLEDKVNQKIFKTCYELYKKSGYINLDLLSEAEVKEFPMNTFIDLLDNTMYFKNSWKEQFTYLEEELINNYKKRLISNVNEKLKSEQITYTEFMHQMKKLDDIKLINSGNLTIEEIYDNLKETNKITLHKFNKLNNTLRLVQGDFVIVGATTGAGKSGLLLNLMEDLMYDYQCIYFNMEMSKRTIYSRLVSIKSNTPIRNVFKPETNYQKEYIDKQIKEIPFNNLIIEHKSTNMKQIKSIIAKNKKDKHTIIFLDHIGLAKIDGIKSLYEQATEVAKELRQICLDYDCTIIAASQLNRSAYNDEINLSMLKDSGEIENSASKVLLMHKQDKPDEAITTLDLEIAKNRDGQKGFIKLEYDKTKQVFIEK